MGEAKRKRPAWLVGATVCDCNKVAAYNMKREMVGSWDEDDSENEIVRTGDDWRPILAEVVTGLADRTGLTISGSCTNFFLEGHSDDIRTIEEEAARILCGLADARKRLQ
jgi:hypothetical protein